MLCRDEFGNQAEEFWDEVHTKLTYLHGTPRLSNGRSNTKMIDALTFLESCDDPHFLDFLEYLFATRVHSVSDRPNMLSALNEFFRQDDLPYAITGFVWTKGVAVRYGNEYETQSLTAYPQVIRRDSEVLHLNAIEPALQLLRNPGFAGANKEFLAALDDFRKADYGDCLIKCGSAFESVLKVICVRKKWPYQPNDTAAPLLRTVINQSGMESFFEQPLILIATLRNKLSGAHGAGQDVRDATEAKAQYAINSTAAAVLLLVSSAGA